MSEEKIRSVRPWWQITLAILLAVILLTLLIPGVRASVSNWLGLSVAPSTQMVATPAAIVPVSSTSAGDSTLKTQVFTPAPQIPEAYPAPDNTQGSLGNAAESNQLADMAGWNVLTPGFLPEGYHFQSAFFDTNNKMLILTYLVTRSLPGASDPSLTSTESISFMQAQRNDFVPMQIAPNTNVTDIEINGLPAVFTAGGWDTEFVKDSTSPNGGKMVSSWRNDLPVKNLYWQVGNLYLLLVTTDQAVSQQDLIDMASNIGK
jgi:hypothetical protein